jgi:hypothetical protein
MDPRGWANAMGIELIISGTCTAKVQYTLDDIFDPNYNAATGNWFDTSVSGSASTAGSLAFPVSALRLNMTAYTSGTGAYFRAIQGSTDGG